MNKIKYIYFDLDGTLLNKEKLITIKTQEIINRLKSDGYKISIMTGRPPYMIKHYKNIVQPNLPIISCNGVVITDQNLDFKTPIYRQFVFKESAQKAIIELMKMEAVFLVYTSEIMYYHDVTDNSDWIKWVKSTINNFPENEKWEFIKIDDNFNISSLDAIKILIITTQMSSILLQKIHNFLKELDNIHLVESQEGVLDVMPINQSKGHALEILQNKKIINLNETMVFGDAQNDIPAMKIAKFSVAMKNAHPKTISSAQDTTKFDHEHEGVYQHLMEVFYNKQNQ